jgi:urease accessory protein
MHRATFVVRRADMGGKICVDTITLARAERWRRRIALQTDRGHALLLDLAEATYLADGDGLLLDTGAYVRVVAAKEPVVEIHAPTPLDLARIAWHIGNRHTPCEIAAGALYIQPDHVLEDMVTGLGGHVHRVMRAFEPEGGAYGHKGALVASHHHGHAQAAHAHAHDHAHGHHPHDHDH